MIEAIGFVVVAVPLAIYTAVSERRRVKAKKASQVWETFKD